MLYPAVNDLLARLVAGLRAILGEKLLGVYVYGSLVWGDFDPDISDVDLLAALASDLDEREFDALDALHRAQTAHDPQWTERIEIAYMTRHALLTFKSERSPIGIISPGEPFHMKDAGIDWLMNWYFVQTYGVTLFGVDPHTIIAPTTQAEFFASVREQTEAWRAYIDHVESRPYQSYAILTMCRAYYTLTHGEQVSKARAAAWTADQLPEWADLIRAALVWRQRARDADVDHAATLAETRRFVFFMIDLIGKMPV